MKTGPDDYLAANYTTVFLLRRLLFAICSVYLGQYFGGLTIIGVLYICMGYQVFYLLPVRPNLLNKDQVIEVISELLLMYFFYGVMMAETFEDQEVKFTIGWYSVSAIVLLLLINLVNIVKDSLSTHYAYFKRLYAIHFSD